MKEHPTLNCPAPDQPEFSKLLEALGKEAMTSGELSDRAYYLTNNLSRIQEQKTEAISDKQKSPEGVTEYLWAEIWKIRKSNEQLQTVVNHLQKVIGS